MPAWRLINDRIASLREIEEHWSIDDIADANDVLDMMLFQRGGE